MKFAVISDIHSNLDYLNTVLRAIKEHGIREVLCAGDLIGYYNSPNEVIELLRNENIPCIKGNHEKYVLGELSFDQSKEAAYGITRHRSQLTVENSEFLHHLPDHREVAFGTSVAFLTHALPGDPEAYLYEARSIDRASIRQFDFYLFGHTHIPMIAYHYGTCLVNPGSVGQPRDRTTRPSFAVVDFSNQSASIVKVEVDVAKYTAKLRQLKLENSLIDILEREKDGTN